jgi:hypothetical protein
MSEQINHERRRFLRNATLTIAAVAAKDRMGMVVPILFFYGTGPSGLRQIPVRFQQADLEE